MNLSVKEFIHHLFHPQAYEIWWEDYDHQPQLLGTAQGHSWDEACAEVFARRFPGGTPFFDRLHRRYMGNALRASEESIREHTRNW